MKEKRKLEVLSLLRELLGQGVHPTLRDAGLTEIEAQELANEGLIQIGDQGIGDELDRYVVADLTDRALTFLTRNKVYPQSHVVAHTPRRPVSERFAQALAKKTWDLIWAAGKIAVGILLGWWLKKHFP